jgi:hypothetical protein
MAGFKSSAAGDDSIIPVSQSCAAPCCQGSQYGPLSEASHHGTIHASPEPHMTPIRASPLYFGLCGVNLPSLFFFLLSVRQVDSDLAPIPCRRLGEMEGWRPERWRIYLCWRRWRGHERSFLSKFCSKASSHTYTNTPLLPTPSRSTPIAIRHTPLRQDSCSQNS